MKQTRGALFPLAKSRLFMVALKSSEILVDDANANSGCTVYRSSRCVRFLPWPKKLPLKYVDAPLLYVRKTKIQGEVMEVDGSNRRNNGTAAIVAGGTPLPTAGLR